MSKRIGQLVCDHCDWEGIPEAFEQFSIVSFARDGQAAVVLCEECRNSLGAGVVSDIAFETFQEHQKQEDGDD